MTLQAEPKPQVHDLADVERAIHELGRADANRLRTAAVMLIRGFHIDPVPHDHEDLLSEAVTRTLAGERSWRQGVDFVQHLILNMRSIASDWRRRAVRRSEEGAGERRESELLSPAAGDDPAVPYGNPRAREPSRHAKLVAAAEVEEIQRHFAGDSEVTQVIACLELEMNGWQTQERTGMSRRQLVTATQRMRRSARRWRSSHGQ